MALTRTEIADIAWRHWGDTGNENVAIAIAVCFAESGGKVDAVNDNFPRWQPDPNSIYRYDYGLWQVNSVHGYNAEFLLSHPDYNAACARAVWDAQGWGAWSTYNVGAHQRFLEPFLPPQNTESIVTPEIAPAPAEEAPVRPESPVEGLPRALTLNEAYLKLTDAFITAYDSNRDTKFNVAGYRYDGTKRYAVYELLVEE